MILSKKELIITVVILTVANIALLWNQQMIVSNDKVNLSHNSIINNGSMMISFDNQIKQDSDIFIFDSYNQKVNFSDVISEAGIFVVIPAKYCSPCFYSRLFKYYQENSNIDIFDLTLISKIEDRKITQFNLEGFSYYLQGDFGLNIEQFNIPFVFALDDYGSISLIASIDMNDLNSFSKIINICQRNIDKS